MSTNRRILFEILDQELRIASEIGKPVAVLMSIADYVDLVWGGYPLARLDEDQYVCGLRIVVRPDGPIQVVVN